MANLLPPLTSQTSDPNPPAAAPPAASGTVNKNMFLQLLVAQLRNQDPLNPTDGTQFLGELAQFQQLEQGVNTGEDIAAMRADLDQLTQPKTNL